MTLTAEQRKAYGPDWPGISRQVRDRSGGQCECQGECGWPRHMPGERTVAGEMARCEARNGELSPYTGSRVVLTAAHLDRNSHEGVHDLTRIKAMCQGCHLSYDRRPQ